MQKKILELTPEEMNTIIYVFEEYLKPLNDTEQEILNKVIKLRNEIYKI